MFISFISDYHPGRNARPPKTTFSPFRRNEKNQKASLNKAFLKKKTIEDQIMALKKSLKEAKIARNQVVAAAKSMKVE